MSYITTTEQLISVCSDLEQSDILFLDTEFLRKRTYYAKLCLIQVCGKDGNAYAIDALAADINLAPLFALIQNTEIMKVFHAGGQDIEILLEMMGIVPSPLFDTQIAAMILGMGDQLGYENMVARLLGKKVDKTQQHTNWAQRPLKDEQITYALNDVLYLRECYPKIVKMLSNQERFSWFEESMTPLYAPEFYRIDPNDAWLRIKKRSHNPHYLARLQRLASWREQEARERNIPKSFIASDDVIQELALTNPKNANQMKRIKGLADSVKLKQQFHEIIASANATPVEECPCIETPHILSPQEDICKDVLKLLLKLKSAQHNVSPNLLCPRSDLDRIIQKHEHVPALQGWRYKLFGKDAIAMLEGKLSLHIEQGKLDISEIV